MQALGSYPLHSAVANLQSSSVQPSLARTNFCLFSRHN